MEWKVGDLVRIAEQPKNQHVDLVGQVGIVEEISDVLLAGVPTPFASLKAIRLDGETAGGGAVPVSCLREERHPQWIAARELHEKKMAELEARLMVRTERWKKKVASIAQAYGLSPFAVESIYKELREFDDGD